MTSRTIQDAVTGQTQNVELGQEFAKRCDDLDDVVVHLPDGLYDRALFPPANVIKRYLGNELAIALELFYEIGGHGRVVAFIHHRSLHYPDGEHEGTSGRNDNQCAVLVNDVEIVNGEQLGIKGTGAGVVWLQPLDKVDNARVADSLYFSFVLGEHVRRCWPFFQDGKLNIRYALAPVVGIRKMPDDMVEARSEMVDNFAGEHAKPERDGALAVVLDCLRNNLLVVIAENRVFALLKKSCDFSLKIEDVLLGPIHLLGDPCEGVR